MQYSCFMTDWPTINITCSESDDCTQACQMSKVTSLTGDCANGKKHFSAPRAIVFPPLGWMLLPGCQPLASAPHCPLSEHIGPVRLDAPFLSRSILLSSSGDGPLRFVSM